MSYVGSGFTPLGLSPVDITYPLTVPTVLWDDFVGWSAASVSNTNYAAPWKSGGTNAATGSVSQSTTTAHGARVSTAGANADEMYVQAGTVGRFAFSNSTSDPQPIVWQAKIAVGTAASTSFGAGLCVATGVNVAADPVGTQCVGAYFVVAAGVVKWCYSTSAETVTVTNAVYQDTGETVAAAANATFITFGIRYDGKGSLTFLVNGRIVKSATLAAFTATAVNPFFGVTAQTAAIHFVDCDYVYCGQKQLAAGR